MARNKLLISTLAGAVALASVSISFSLAWYATSTRLHIDSINIEISSERDLKIAKQVIEGGEKIPSTFKDELTYDYDFLDARSAFAPVSTMFESKWREEKEPRFYEYTSGILPSDGVPYGPDSIEIGYFKQHVYLQADDDVYVSLDINNSFLKSDHDKNVENAPKIQKESVDFKDYDVDTIIENLDKMEKCLRVSIYSVEDDMYTIIDPHKEGITYYGGILDNDKDQTFDTYIDSNGIEREVIYGELNSRDYIRYGEALTEDIVPTGEYSCFNAIHRKGVLPFDSVESANQGLEFKEEESITMDDLSSHDINLNKMVIPCYSNQPKELVISIYLEGWDLDCTNAVMGASFLAQIQFKILREM